VGVGGVGQGFELKNSGRAGGIMGEGAGRAGAAGGGSGDQEGRSRVQWEGGPDDQNSGQWGYEGSDWAEGDGIHPGP
jgi:hypothetical protein